MIVNVTLPSDGTTADVADYNDPLTQILAAINGQLDDNNISSLSGTKIVAGTIPQSALNVSLNLGWIIGAISAPTAVTNNGNGSYDMTFSSSMAAILAIGFRVRTTRTVTAPTYMSSTLNGTNQFFTKTSPTGSLSTVTNNFTLMGWLVPASYAGADGAIIGRADAALNNGFWMQYKGTSGVLEIGVTNGGVGNLRSIKTQQTVPINERVFVAMTWASGTVTAYVNGMSIPVATAVTTGTAPTAAGTGGDFSVGKLGAFGNFFNGNISGAAVFDAVLSQANIRSYMNQVLAGNESNCIGAWSLNNTPNDQNAAGNNLTAQNSASYTSGLSPFATLSDGVAAGTQDIGIVTKVNGTTVTVQVPKGCTIPTSGGVSAIAYAPSGNPFGWTSDRGRWQVTTAHKTQSSQVAVASTIYNIAGLQLSVPTGTWVVGYDFMIQSNAASGVAAIIVVSLSTSSSVINDDRLTGKSETSVTSGTPSSSGCNSKAEIGVSISSPVVYYLLETVPGISNNTLYLRGDQKVNQIYAIPAGI